MRVAAAILLTVLIGQSSFAATGAAATSSQAPQSAATTQQGSKNTTSLWSELKSAIKSVTAPIYNWVVGPEVIGNGGAVAKTSESAIDKKNRDPLGLTLKDIPENPLKDAPYLATMNYVQEKLEDNQKAQIKTKELRKTKQDYLNRPKEIEAQTIKNNRENHSTYLAFRARTDNIDTYMARQNEIRDQVLKNNRAKYATDEAYKPGQRSGLSVAREKEIKDATLANNLKKVATPNALVPRANFVKTIPGKTAGTPFASFITGLFGQPNLPISLNNLKFQNDTIFGTRGLDGLIESRQITEPNGKKLEGKILGFSKKYMYIESLKNPLLISRWDLSNGSINLIELKKPLVAFTAWGDRVYGIVNGEGLVSFDEKTWPFGDDKSWKVSLGENNFAPNQIEMFPTGLLVMGEKSVFKVDFKTGKTFAYAVPELLAALRKPVKLTPNMITSTERKDDEEGIRDITTYSNGWVEIASKGIVEEEIDGPILLRKDKKSLKPVPYASSADKLVELTPADVKIKKFLGVQSNRAVFFVEDGKIWENPLVVLHLVSGNNPDKAQLVYGADQATGFYIDQNILHVFISSLISSTDEEKKYQVQDAVYDLSHALPKRIEVQKMETGGKAVRTAKRIGKNILGFDESGNLVASSPISAEVLSQNTLIKEICGRPMEEILKKEEIFRKNLSPVPRDYKGN